MSYLLNLELPLWWFFLPLIVALVPSAKWSKWKAKYYKAQYKAETNALQLVRDYKRHKAESDAYQIELHKLKHDAVEREALINSLNRQIERKRLEIADNETTIEQLESKLQLSELAHNETKADLEGLEQQFTEALSVINRTKRATKQWNKIMKDKAVNMVKTVIEAVKQKQAETVTHDSLGVPTITQADQSEDFNARHIKELGSEVVRGIAEQNQAIKKELQQVDITTLKEGYKVESRIGIVRTVVKMVVCHALNDSDKHIFKVKFSDNPFNHYYDKFGNYEIGALDNMDIVRIIKD